MKVENWSVQPVRKRGRQRRNDDIHVESVIATRDARRVVLHRVERTLPNGKKEIFIIKASPREMKIDH